MSSISSDESVGFGAVHKSRERVLIAGALGLVVCRFISVKHSVAAMVVATLVLTAVFTWYVRSWPWGRKWAFRITLPVAAIANALAVSVGTLVTVLAEKGWLVNNHLGLYVSWNRAFVCVPIAALVNLLACGWPTARRPLQAAAWLANGTLAVYAASFWAIHESFERFGGAPPLGADLVVALAAVSMMTLAWENVPARGDEAGRRRWSMRCVFVPVVAVATWLAFMPACLTVIRRCRTEAELTALGCEVTDRTRRIAPLRIRELAPLRPYVTEIEAVFVPREVLVPDAVETVARVLGTVHMLDEVEADYVPEGCGGLFDRLPAGSLMQYVTLDGPGIDDHTLAQVGRFKRLRRAIFIAPRITDEGLRSLSRLRWLESLALRGAPLSGSGLVHLVSLPSLSSLDLSDTPIGDDEIGALGQLTGLIDLDLTGTNVTLAGLEKLQQALPRCQIRWSPSSP
ncbi:MAG TPA: hypothetical protein VHC22_33785 [Pirellulales bacterium]|nr:hypothetical protein [Pirellulales bacterium]